MRQGFVLSASIVLDAALFGLNLFVALLGGSRVVLSQAVFAGADLVGLVMLGWGFLASQRAPDVDHPFGYGKERFFWAFIASLVTFSLAGLGVLITGIDQALAPRSLTQPLLSLLVVGGTLAASLVGLWVVLKELRSTQSSVVSFLESSQQSMKTVFYQDLVSAVGSTLAFGGIAAVYATGSDVLDGLVAAGVGLVMMLTGIFLAAESRELLVGKSLTRLETSRILAIVEKHPRLRRVRGIQSMLLGPDDALLALKLNFQDGMTTDEIEHTIDEISFTLRNAMPVIRHIIIEPES